MTAMTCAELTHTLNLKKTVFFFIFWKSFFSSSEECYSCKTGNKSMQVKKKKLNCCDSTGGEFLVKL